MAARSALRPRGFCLLQKPGSTCGLAVFPLGKSALASLAGLETYCAPGGLAGGNRLFPAGWQAGERRPQKGGQAMRLGGGGRKDGAGGRRCFAGPAGRQNQSRGGGRRPPPQLWRSKKWLAPLFRGVHSSLAPTARPGSYARKPLLRKAFCGFDAHPPGGLLLSLRDNSPCVAKSDQSLRRAKPSAASGGRSEAEAQ